MDDKNRFDTTYDPVANGKWKGSVEECIKFIRDDIEEIKTTIDKIHNKINKIAMEVEILKIKSGVWGFLAGLLPAMVAFLYWLINK